MTYDVLFASHNQGKVREVRRLLDRLPIALHSLTDMGLEEPLEETGHTFRDNAVQKASQAIERFGRPTLADDSGLEVDALNGAPGVFSARFAGEHSDAVTNNAKLLTELATVPAAERTARFRCVAVLMVPPSELYQRLVTYLTDPSQPSPSLPYLEKPAPDRLLFTFEGSVEGRILDSPRGQDGFGYDPLFYYEPLGKTFAELDLDVKNRLSHRGEALADMVRFLSNVFVS